MRQGVTQLPYRVFNLDQVAVYLHLPVQEVKEFVRTREIPCALQGDRWVFRQKEIDAWASQRIIGLSKQRLTVYHRKTSAKVHDLSKRHAMIPELVKPAYIMPKLHSKTKASIIRSMVDLAGSTGLVTDWKDLLGSIDERERLCSTALVGGIALLHPRNHEPYMFDDSFVVLGRTIQPVPFGSPDGAMTDLFFLICCQDDRIHLHVLTRLCMMCHYTSVLLELREAADAASMYSLMIQAEREIIRQL
jgi:PTS system nitrogen regulatory IIA component